MTKSVKKAKIWFKDRPVAAKKALLLLTDEYIKDGNYCDQTVVDLRDFSLLVLEDLERLSLPNLKLEKLVDNT